jgi:hypothetical protein
VSALLKNENKFAGSSSSCLQGAYLAGHDKFLISDGTNVGLRSDYSGVLLLDSILQTPVNQTQQTVRVELPLSEVCLDVSQGCSNLIEQKLQFQALILHKALTQMSELPGADQYIHEVTQQLAAQFHQSQNQQLPSSKAAKVNHPFPV